MPTSSMTDVLYDYFTSRILFGYYVPGDHLPSVGDMSRQFQVSALTVQAALARMREDGYIETVERQCSTVIYRPDRRREQRYRESFLARREGMDDIFQNACLLFVPFARLYWGRQDAASLQRIRSQLQKTEGHPAKQITLFYAQAMQPLQNPLALNLYWEMVRYLRIPYLRRPASFNDTDAKARAHMSRMLALAEAGRPAQAAEEMRAFSQDVMLSFFRNLPGVPDAGRPAEPVAFEWQIYRERPQRCYTLAAAIMDRIDRGIYPRDELLPSCRKLAAAFRVSLSTMRRTLELLGDMRVTETRNGIGTAVIAGQNPGEPDFSNPQIRKSLVLFLQALQISALTCRSVAAHTLSSLDGTELQALDDQIQRGIDDQRPYLLVEICLQFIGKNSSSALIREVYRQLCQLQLWGHGLHVFFQSTGRRPYYDGCAARLQESLRRRDIPGFSDQLSELIAAGFKVSKALLRGLGFEEWKLP